MDQDGTKTCGSGSQTLILGTNQGRYSEEEIAHGRVKWTAGGGGGGGGKTEKKTFLSTHPGPAPKPGKQDKQTKKKKI
jgi:hypothetical protein